MTTESENPALFAFNTLLALRDRPKTNPNDAHVKFLTCCATYLTQSNAQLFQDLFVAFFLEGKQKGFFVEFGATNGIDLSNTLFLERNLNWSGILAEPARCWHEALKKNRKASIDTRCVWSETGQEMEFSESQSAELSTLDAVMELDPLNQQDRANGQKYNVESVSLDDLLKHHGSPKTIDYLSIDTEGSELQILKAFDFQNYDVKTITVEHNYREHDREQIHRLLSENGFVRIFEIFSQFDDWYIKRSILEK